MHFKVKKNIHADRQNQYFFLDLLVLFNLHDAKDLPVRNAG